MTDRKQMRPLEPGEYINEYYDDPETLYVEVPREPGTFREWRGPGGHYAFEYGYTLYRLADSPARPDLSTPNREPKNTTKETENTNTRRGGSNLPGPLQ